MKTLFLCFGFVLFSRLAGSSDLFWDNGRHDGRTGFKAYRLNGYEYWTADDFKVQSSWRITSAAAEFYVDLYGNKPFRTADVAIWKQPKPGKEPGDPVAELKDLPLAWEQVGEGFGLPIISVQVTGLDIALPPGDYYFGMRLVAGGGYGNLAWLCTAGNGSIQGWNGGWFWNNHPWQWEPVWWYFSAPLLARLATSDFAFSLYGERL